MTAHFEDLLIAISQFKLIVGHTNVPAKYLMPGGARLGLAVQELRKEKKEGKLSQEEIYLLESIGFKWEAPAEMLNKVEKGVEMYLKERGI